MSRTILSCLGFGLAAAAVAGSGGVAAPFVGALAGGVAGNLATDLFKALDRRVAERFLDGWSSIDENHHVDRALRLAQINALRAVLKRFDDTRASDHDPARQSRADGFSHALSLLLDAETTATQTLAFAQGSDVAPDEHAIRRTVLDALPVAFDQGLATRRATGDRSALIDSLAQVRASVEAAVLAEIRLRTLVEGEDVPPLFRAAFEGTNFPEGWFDLFVRDAASKIKAGDDFERIWNAEQVALVKAIAQAQTAGLERIDRRTERTETAVASHTSMLEDHTSKLDEVLALLRDGDVYQRAAAQGIPEAAVRAIVERLGGEGIDPKDLLPWLDNWIEAARVELGRRSNEGEAFEAARREAERRFRAGRINGASAAFMEELAREERLEADRQDERKRQRLRLLEEAIRFDELAFDAPAVVPKLRMMATIEGVAGADALGAWLHEKAHTFYERGRDKGNNAALAVAITIYHTALQERTRERVPLDWAMTQNNHGNALLTLGSRESGTGRLGEAVAAYREALEELTRERVPLDWAGTQNNLGNALQTLGARESGTARLEEAVAAYRAALQEFTRERVPLDWAATQTNLGLALATLGERESGTERLEEAVAAHRAALEERTRERVPLDWAMTQNNLGNALQMLGGRESGTARLEEAVAAYRAALQERTRERVPLVWATTQNNLGTALRTLGERESGTARLEEAVAAFGLALEERTCERVPLDWATTQNNLGTALWTLGERERESGAARLEEAVAAYRAALQEFTRERVPLDWAATQNNLGAVLATLGQRESGTARLEEAVAAYRAALEEWTRERVPLDWAMTQNNLGKALRVLGERESGTARLDEAVVAFDACLTVIVSAWPPEWVSQVRARADETLAEIKQRMTS